MILEDRLVRNMFGPERGTEKHDGESCTVRSVVFCITYDLLLEAALSRLKFQLKSLTVSIRRYDFHLLRRR